MDFRIHSESPLRLDASLAEVMTGMSTRARRRLWLTHDVLVNGIRRPAGYTVRQGDAISLVPKAPSTGDLPSDTTLGTLPYIIDMSADYAALYKPHGLHSARITGIENRNLEDILSTRWEAMVRDFHTRQGQQSDCEPTSDVDEVHLLNRLDEPTSGIVMAARTDEAITRFREWEAAQQVEKTYFALLCGELVTPLTLRQQLDTAKRRVTKVMLEESTDKARHTHIEPLVVVRPGSGFWDALPPELSETSADDTIFTMARVTLWRGARHQIRTHAAAAGYPIVGDALYGNMPELSEVRLYLHHARISMPGFTCVCMPEWNLGEMV